MNGYAKVKFDDIELRDNMRRSTRDLSGMKESIKAIGLQIPLLVQYIHSKNLKRSDGKVVNSRYLLLDGYGRYECIGEIRAEHRGAFDEVPVTLAKVNDTEAEALMLAANVAHEDFTPADIAEGIRRLDNLGMKVEDIHRKTGLSKSYVSTLLSIHKKCSPRVLAALGAGDITADTARDISKLDDEAQVKELGTHRETKATRGKAEAKRQTKKRTGGKQRGSIREAENTIPLVISAVRKAGGSDVDKARWRGAQEIVDYLVGNDDGDGIMQEAEKILAAGEGTAP